VISRNSTPGSANNAGRHGHTANPEWPTLTLAELLQDELMQMQPNPQPFDG